MTLAEAAGKDVAVPMTTPESIVAVGPPPAYPQPPAEPPCPSYFCGDGMARALPTSKDRDIVSRAISAFIAS